MKKTASKVAKPAQIQPKSQFQFHKNLPTRDFSIMTLTEGLQSINQMSYFGFFHMYDLEVSNFISKILELKEGNNQIEKLPPQFYIQLEYFCLGILGSSGSKEKKWIWVFLSNF